MKSEVNVINIAGALISAGLIPFAYFLPSQSTVFNAKEVSLPQARKVTIPNTELGSQVINKASPSTLAAQPCTVNQQSKNQEQKTTLEIQKQNLQPRQSADKSQESCKPNGCPKNLDYYTKKPRPKQTPEECITCKNLISCICLTDSQRS